MVSSMRVRYLFLICNMTAFHLFPSRADRIGTLRGEPLSELECTSCGSTCVEYTGQAVEAFLRQSDNQQPIHADIRPVDGATVLREMVNQVLALGVQVRPSEEATVLSLIRQSAAESGRPVGVLIRQYATQAEFDAIRSLFNPNMEPTSTASGIVRSMLTNSTHRRDIFFGQSAATTGAGAPFSSLRGSSSTANLLDESRLLQDLLNHILQNEISHPPSRGVDGGVIESLLQQSSKKFGSESEQRRLRLEGCSISHEPIDEGTEAIVMPCCNRCFGQEALLTWLRGHNTCPVCRRVVDESLVVEPIS